MNQYLHSLSQGLGGLLRFSGRSTQRDFWFYAATVIGLTMIGPTAMGAVVAVDMFQRITRFAAEHPELATVTEGPGSYSVSIEGFYPELFPDVSPVITASGICVVMSIVLLAAAISRRLHDVGRSAFWGLLPLPFGVTGFVVISQFLRQLAASIGCVAANIGRLRCQRDDAAVLHRLLRQPAVADRACPTCRLDGGRQPAACEPSWSAASAGGVDGVS